MRIPGNTNIAPVNAHHKARKNLTINLDAGPLKKIYIYMYTFMKLKYFVLLIFTEKIGHGCVKTQLSFH